MELLQQEYDDTDSDSNSGWGRNQHKFGSAAAAPISESGSSSVTRESSVAVNAAKQTRSVEDLPKQNSDTNYLGLISDDTDTDDSSSSSVTDCQIPAKKKRLEANESKAKSCSKVKCSFWDSSVEDNWSRPQNVWGENSSTVSEYGNSLVSGEISIMTGQTNSERELNSNNSQYNRGLNIKNKPSQSDTSDSNFQLKSPYVVHHKINPLLHRTNLECRWSNKPMIELDGHHEAVNRIQWCRSDYSHLLASGSMDRTVKVWNIFATSAHCVRQISSHKKAVKDVAWSANARQILSCSYDRSARINDVEYGKEIYCCEHEDFVTCGRYHPTNHNLFLVGGMNALLCYDVRSISQPTQRYTYKDNFGQVQDITFLVNGNQFFSCNDMVSRDSADRTIMAWDFQKGVVLSNQIYQERYTCTRLKVHPSEPVFVAQSQGDYIAEFSTTRPYKINRCKRFQNHKVAGYNIGCDFSPDGKMLVSGSTDGDLVFYNHQYGKRLKTLTVARHDPCVDVTWHPVLPSTVATATWNGKISVWQ